MATVIQQAPPKSGKCDILEGIFLGNEETKALRNKHKTDFTPKKMIEKLGKIQEETKDIQIKDNAKKAIKFLASFNQDSPLHEANRKEIFEKIF